MPFLETAFPDSSFLISERDGSRLKQQFAKDWHQILKDEKTRLKSKELESKSIIMKLSGELRREQDRVITELASQAAVKRKVKQFQFDHSEHRANQPGCSTLM